MTRGKWLILALLIILASLLTFAVREKHSKVTGDVASVSVSAISGPEAVTNVELPMEFSEVNESPAQKIGRHLQIMVQNESGQPLIDARVLTKIRTEKSQAALTNFNSDLSTDASGVADVLWPMEQFKQLEVSVSKTNYSPRKMTWDFETGDTVPASYIIKLKSGFHIGGMVVDPEGNPIPDAKLSVSRTWSTDDEAPKKKGEQPTFSSQKFTSDSNGRWSARDLPLEFLSNLRVEAKHTNYLSAQAWLREPTVEKELRDETHRLVLKHGLGVRGRVLDEQNNPIAGVKVWAGRKFFRDRQETKSDDEGVFVFRNVDEGEVLFSAMGAGYEPASQSHEVKNDGTAEIVFRLSKGSMITGQIVDIEGAPVQGVRVVLEGRPGEPAYDHYEFSATTDEDGKFEWTSAPNQPMPFYIAKTGYQQKRGVRLKPSEENLVTLLRNREIKGQVLDAETGEPVTQFRIATGRKMNDRFYSELSGGAKDFTSSEGLFTIKVSEEQDNGIQASAKDYAEQVEDLPVAKDEAPVQMVLRLKPSAALQGVVITPNGQPVADAGVAFVEGEFGGRSVNFSKGRMSTRGSQAKLVKTDASGRFSIPVPKEQGTIVASSEEGFGSASVANVRSSGVVTLQLFGRIEGVILRGSTVAEGQELSLNSPDGGISFAGEKATSDANGRFAFEKVPAGTLSIIRLVKTTSRSWTHSHGQEVIVVGGQTTHVTLGGVDATVQGHVRFETEPTENLMVIGRLSTASSPLPKGLSSEEMMALIRSPEWKEQNKNRKNYSVIVSKDGSLNLDSIAPGDYTLTITAQKSSEDSFNAKPVARGETKVSVPFGSHPLSPINIGEIVLRP